MKAEVRYTAPDGTPQIKIITAERLIVKLRASGMTTVEAYDDDESTGFWATNRGYEVRLDK